MGKNGLEHVKKQQKHSVTRGHCMVGWTDDSIGTYHRQGEGGGDADEAKTQKHTA